jgi:hypothetical protein
LTVIEKILTVKRKRQSTLCNLEDLCQSKKYWTKFKSREHSLAGDAAIHSGIDEEPSWDRQTSRHANNQFDLRTTELSRDDTTSHSTSVVNKRPSYSAVKTSRDQTSRNVRVKPDRNRDVTDERLHYRKRAHKKTNAKGQAPFEYARIYSLSFARAKIPS